jgi:hypothetical protein
MDDESKRLIKAHILSRFGGLNAVADICGVSISAVSQWDIIPAVHQMKLYAYAQKRRMKFDAEEFHTVPKKELNRSAVS